MALPKLDTPTYQLELPSNKQVVKYRPFLVKEQKILMMAQESDDKTDAYNIASLSVKVLKLVFYVLTIIKLEFPSKSIWMRLMFKLKMIIAM